MRSWPWWLLCLLSHSGLYEAAAIPNTTRFPQPVTLPNTSPFARPSCQFPPDAKDTSHFTTSRTTMLQRARNITRLTRPRNALHGIFNAAIIHSKALLLSVILCLAKIVLVSHWQKLGPPDDAVLCAVAGASDLTKVLVHFTSIPYALWHLWVGICATSWTFPWDGVMVNEEAANSNKRFFQFLRKPTNIVHGIANAVAIRLLTVLMTSYAIPWGLKPIMEVWRRFGWADGIVPTLIVIVSSVLSMLVDLVSIPYSLWHLLVGIRATPWTFPWGRRDSTEKDSKPSSSNDRDNLNSQL